MAGLFTDPGEGGWVGVPVFLGLAEAGEQPECGEWVVAGESGVARVKGGADSGGGVAGVRGSEKGEEFGSGGRRRGAGCVGLLAGFAVMW